MTTAESVDAVKPAKEEAKKKPWFLISFLTVAAALFLIYNEVENQPYKIYSKAEDIPAASVAIVFGAGIGSREFNDRIATAVNLYKLGKVKKLLMTGDNGQLSYNEPEAMKREAVKAGVPERDVTCDYAGFRTYDSLFRAVQIFGVTEAILVTQKYHLPRAMYLAGKLGLTASGIDAGIQSYGSIQQWYDFREVVAAEFAWLDVMTGRKPKFLGKKEPLFP
jgi:SanA protein